MEIEVGIADSAPGKHCLLGVCFDYRRGHLVDQIQDVAAK